MKTTNREAPQHRRSRLDAPQVAQIDLSEERKRVRHQAGWNEHGHAATTLFKYPDVRAVLIGMKPGARMREHQTDGRVSLQCLSGRVRIHALDQVVDLTAGHIVTLEKQVPHDVEAIEECDLLLTVAISKSATDSKLDVD